MKGVYVFEREIGIIDADNRAWLLEQLRDARTLLFAAMRPLTGDNTRHIPTGPTGTFFAAIGSTDPELNYYLSRWEDNDAHLILLLSEEEAMRMVTERMPETVRAGSDFDELLEKHWRSSFRNNGQVFAVDLSRLLAASN